MILIKTEEEISHVRKACQVAGEVLGLAGKIIKDGITTVDLDKYIEDELIRRGAKPAFKGYRGYRHASCLSINEEIVHGIPSPRVINDGDIVGVDVGSIVNGYYGDTAETFAVGKVAKSAKKLINTTKECLAIAIKQARKGNHIGDIGFVIEEHAQRHGYNVVKDFFGHGVGKDLHEDPLVPNFGKKGSGARLEKGMIFAIEPMLNIGRSETQTLDDGWTVITKDKTLSAHFEHTVLITDGDAEVLTKSLPAGRRGKR